MQGRIWIECRMCRERKAFVAIDFDTADHDIEQKVRAAMEKHRLTCLHYARVEGRLA